jgi:hypothetical protein
MLLTVKNRSAYITFLQPVVQAVQYRQYSRLSVFGRVEPTLLYDRLIGNNAQRWKWREL